MINERQFLAQVLGAKPVDFAAAMKTASGDAERVLRTHFGDDQFERMQARSQKVTATPQGAVVMLPGILGSALFEASEHIWLSPWNLIRGEFDQLQLDAAGASLKTIQAPNLLKEFYGEMQLALLENWNVVSFPYDWRLDITVLARQLKDQIDKLLRPTDSFSFVVHSLGGLVARSFLQQFPEQGKRVQRFIMMGTPNYGSYAIPLLYSGLNDVMKIVALIDVQHNMDALLQFAKTFVATYQMLPFVEKARTDGPKLLQAATYGKLNPAQQRLDTARDFQKAMNPVIEAEKMTYIAGYGMKTADGIVDFNKLTSWDGYSQTLNGDGTVPHSLGFIDGVPNYFVHGEHSSLPANALVIQAVQDILKTGSTNKLPGKMPQISAFAQDLMAVQRVAEDAARRLRAHALRDIVQLEKRVHPDAISRSEAALAEMIFTTHGLPQAGNAASGAAV